MIIIYIYIIIYYYINMINYKKTILYKIYNSINDEIYYGISANKTTSHLLAYYKNYF